MTSDLLSILLAFIEGFALIISPCILPILPIILAGSLHGSKSRPIGIIVGFILAFTLFTFFARQLVQYLPIDFTYIRYFSYLILIIFGLIMISDYLSEKFETLNQKVASAGTKLSDSTYQHEDFLSGMIFGALIGLIWTPCAGPILAAVIVQTIVQQTTFTSFLIILAFGMGTAVPMLLIALFGKSFISKLGFFKKHAILLRKILGAIIILSVIYLIYAEYNPSAFNILNTSTPKTSTNTNQNKLINGIIPYEAPKIEGITNWINSEPLSLNQLKGNVVLIDFWAYSCINCIRTFPYLKDWYQKYHDKGFEIIGVHSPEFDFEKDYENVRNAVIKNNILYPVALDNKFETWRNFHNSYWPAHYLIDQSGNVVYVHFGEGEYETTENNIRFLLGLNKMSAAEEQNGHYQSSQTPETYLGYARMNNYASPETILYNKPFNYSFPPTLKPNQWALKGTWKVSAEKIVAMEPNASLRIHFQAKNVYIVMGNASLFPIQVKLLLNGKPLDQSAGKDVKNSELTVKDHTLYEVLKLNQFSSGILELNAQSPGIEIYTFTFGS